MKNVKCLFVLVIFASLYSTAYCQAVQRVCDTIPYSLIHGKMVVAVTVQDTLVNFILDTGGQSGVVHSFAKRVDVKVKGNRSVGDFSGKGMAFSEAEMTDVKYGSRYKLTGLKVLVFPENPFFTQLGVVGLLGSDAFKECVLTIDSKNQVVVINYPFRPLRLKVEDGEPLIPTQTSHSLIKVDFGGEKIDVLFDTGAQGMLMFSEVDNIKYGKKIGVKELDGFFGINAVGIGGLGDPCHVKKVVVPQINFFGKQLNNVETILSANGRTIIGYDILQYGKVIIDYMRGVFYFMPYDNVEVAGISLAKHWNVEVLPVKDGFIVSRVWNDMTGVVEYGDRVSDINGVSLDGVEKSQMAVEKIMHDIDGDTAYLTVKDKYGKQKKITINRK